MKVGAGRDTSTIITASCYGEVVAQSIKPRRVELQVQSSISEDGRITLGNGIDLDLFSYHGVFTIRVAES
jgi:hypothetical protein